MNIPKQAIFKIAIFKLMEKNARKNLIYFVEAKAMRRSNVITETTILQAKNAP